MNDRKCTEDRARRLLLRALLIGATGVFLLHGQVTISNVDHRPLVGALDAIEQSSGLPVNYEDVPYQNPADLEDVSTPQQRALYPTFRLLVPRRGQVSAILNSGPLFTSATDNIPAIDLLLSSYRTNQMPGDFAVEQANGMLYVIAARVLAASGAVSDVKSPMKARVTVPYAERSVADTVAAILDAVLRTTGTSIELGAVPFLPTEMVSFGASQAPARDVLASLFAQVTKTPTSYRLLYDPLSGYMLNIQAVGTTRTSTNVPLTPQPASQSPTTGSPGFTKP